jgi:hypothetical protein
MSVQTNFRAVDMLGSSKAAAVVAAPVEVKTPAVAVKKEKPVAVVEETVVVEPEVVEETPVVDSEPEA